MQLVELPELAAVAARYAGLRMRPVRVICEPVNDVAGYDPPNLDNLLARRVLEHALQQDGLPPLPDDQAYLLPAPLAVLWRDRDGLPLYAATPLVAADDGPAVADVVYWHKRRPSGALVRAGRGGRAWTPQSEKGRYAERRIPTPTLVAERLVADAIGHPGEIALLLEGVTTIGKRRGAGHGRVRGWRIEPLEQFTLVDGAGRLRRPLPWEAVEPCRAWLAGREPAGLPAAVGWTVPQWRPALWRPGWRTGTPTRPGG